MKLIRLNACGPPRETAGAGKRNLLKVLKAGPLVAGLLVVISGCGKDGPVKKVTEAVKTWNDKRYRDIKPTPAAGIIYKSYDGFEVEAMYRGRDVRFEITSSCAMVTRYSCKIRRYTQNGPNAYTETRTSWPECNMIDYDYDLRPDVLRFTIRNTEKTVYPQGQGIWLAWDNVFTKKANRAGDTVFVVNFSLTDFSEAEVKRIFTDAEKEMCSIYDALHIKKKLAGYKDPFVPK